MHLAPTIVEEAGRHALAIDREDTENKPTAYDSLCDFTSFGGSCSLRSSDLWALDGQGSNESLIIYNEKNSGSGSLGQGSTGSILVGPGPTFRAGPGCASRGAVQVAY